MRLPIRSEEHTSELQSHDNLVCRLLLEKKKTIPTHIKPIFLPHFSVDRMTSAHYDLRVRGVLAARTQPRFSRALCAVVFFFFLNERAPPEIYPLPQPAALPI